MLYQQDEIAVGSLCQCLFDITFLGEVLAVAIVLHTCNYNMVLVAAEDLTLIVQQCPTQLLLQTDRLLAVSCLDGIVATQIFRIVMIAEHREDAVCGLQFAQGVLVGIEVCWLDVQQVACEDDHIRMLGVDAVDGFLKHIGVTLLVTTYMGI